MMQPAYLARLLCKYTPAGRVASVLLAARPVCSSASGEQLQQPPAATAGAMEEVGLDNHQTTHIKRACALQAILSSCWALLWMAGHISFPLLPQVKEGKDYSFPKEEEKILALWEKLDAFKEQLRRTEGMPEYIFYDGPPFATGLPHYGHILAGTLKVCVCGGGLLLCVCD